MHAHDEPTDIRAFVLLGLRSVPAILLTATADCGWLCGRSECRPSCGSPRPAGRTASPPCRWRGRQAAVRRSGDVGALLAGPRFGHHRRPPPGPAPREIAAEAAEALLADAAERLAAPRGPRAPRGASTRWSPRSRAPTCSSSPATASAARGPRACSRGRASWSTTPPPRCARVETRPMPDGLAGRTCSSPAGAMASGRWRCTAARDGANVALLPRRPAPPQAPRHDLHGGREIEAGEAGRYRSSAIDKCGTRTRSAARRPDRRSLGGVDIVGQQRERDLARPDRATELKRDLMLINVRGLPAMGPAFRTCASRTTATSHGAPDPAWTRRGSRARPLHPVEDGHDDAHASARRELRETGVAANTLWPRTIIATAAVQNLLGGDEAMRRCAPPRSTADARYEILSRPSREATGKA